jgi:hypothetical protein
MMLPDFRKSNTFFGVVLSFGPSDFFEDEDGYKELVE